MRFVRSSGLAPMSEQGPASCWSACRPAASPRSGGLVAERLDRPSSTPTTWSAERSGSPVADYIRCCTASRPPATRRREAVAEACAAPGAVIATGGGAVLDPLNRWALWHHGTVAWLDVQTDELLRRLAADDVARPTIEPYGAERLATVLADRRSGVSGGRPAARCVSLARGSRGQACLAAWRRCSGRRLLRRGGRSGTIRSGRPTRQVVMGVDLAGGGTRRRRHRRSPPAHGRARAGALRFA